jgi:replicative DNA helicase
MSIKDYNIKAEEKLLGLFLTDKNSLSLNLDVIKSDFFYLEENKYVFDALSTA